MRVQNMSLNNGTDKLHVKNPSEKWGGLRGKSFRTFYAIVVFSVCCFCFMFSFFDSYFVEILSPFNSGEVLW